MLSEQQRLLSFGTAVSLQQNSKTVNRLCVDIMLSSPAHGLPQNGEASLWGYFTYGERGWKHLYLGRSSSCLGCDGLCNSHFGKAVGFGYTFPVKISVGRMIYLCWIVPKHVNDLPPRNMSPRMTPKMSTQKYILLSLMELTPKKVLQGCRLSQAKTQYRRQKNPNNLSISLNN